MEREIPREIEVKLAVASAEEAREVLARGGFVELHARAFESNVVFDTPPRELYQSGRLLRLRDFRGEAIVTYKGPADPGPHKSRPEIETRVEDAMAFRQILEALGYEAVFRYEKYRTTFSKPGQPGHAVLDETPIGVFLELEGEPNWIDSSAEMLGFGPAQYILKSYAVLYLDYCRRAGIEPGQMVFGGIGE